MNVIDVIEKMILPIEYVESVPCGPTDTSLRKQCKVLIRVVLIRIQPKFPILELSKVCRSGRLSNIAVLMVGMSRLPRNLSLLGQPQQVDDERNCLICSNHVLPLNSKSFIL